MMNAIKKTLLAGLGAAAVTKDKVESALDELVVQGKLSATDARAVARKLTREGRREFDTLSAELGEKIHEISLKSAAEAQVRLRQLEARLQQFERQAKARRPAPARRPKAPRRRSA